MLFSQQVLLMTLFITEVIDDILLAVLIIHHLYKYLFWGIAGKSDIARKQCIEIVALSTSAKISFTMFSPSVPYFHLVANKSVHLDNDDCFQNTPYGKGNFAALKSFNVYKVHYKPEIHLSE